jgi:hypothetical protein
VGKGETKKKMPDLNMFKKAKTEYYSLLMHHPNKKKKDKEKNAKMKEN